jgi:hypothetical protein
MLAAAEKSKGSRPAKENSSQAGKSLLESVIMKIITLTLALLLPTVALAQQQNQTFRDASGREVGRSVTDSRGSTTFYDAMGREVGRSVTSGGTTTVYDQIGRQTGTIRSR